MSNRLTDPQGKPLYSGQDLSDVRPGHLALILEQFMDHAKVPLHVRLAACFQLASNYLWLALKPSSMGDDA